VARNSRWAFVCEEAGALYPRVENRDGWGSPLTRNPRRVRPGRGGLEIERCRVVSAALPRTVNLLVGAHDAQPRRGGQSIKAGQTRGTNGASLPGAETLGALAGAAE
jgi:hypothetical protein